MLKLKFHKYHFDSIISPKLIKPCLSFATSSLLLSVILRYTSSKF